MSHPCQFNCGAIVEDGRDGIDCGCIDDYGEDETPPRLGYYPPSSDETWYQPERRSRES